MSKCGRKPIAFESSLQVEITGNTVVYKGKEASGKYLIPSNFVVKKEENKILITPKEESKTANERREVNRLWGMHRALLNNAITGAYKLFEKKMKIEGLGFKVIAQGNILNFSLGFSHKIDFTLPEGVTAEIDKSGQVFTLRSFNKELVGLAASKIRGFKPPEPYKGKGIRYADEKVTLKEGKKK